MSVEHDPGQQRFTIPLGESHATLSYERLDDGILDVYSVFVPASHRHQGHAARLTQAAMTFARDNNLKVRATCPYVAAFVARSRDEYADLMA